MKDEIEVLKLLKQFCKEHNVVIYSHDSMFEGGQGSVIIVVKSTPFRAKYVSASIDRVSIDSTVMIAEGEPHE